MDVKVLLSGLRFPEGPVVTSNGRVFCVELLGGCITQYHRDTGSATRFAVGGAPNGLVVKDDYTLVFCDSGMHAIRSLDLRTGKTSVLADHVNGERLNAPNDLIFDHKGNLLFTCPGGSQANPVGYVCVLKPNGEVTKIADGLKFPNGLLLLNDGKRILLNETWNHRLLIGTWGEAESQIHNLQPFYTIGGSAEPDGLTLSSDGLIHAAVYGTGMVWVFDETGGLLRQIGLPGQNPTNLCFDQMGDLGLLVTEAQKGQLLSVR